MVIREDNSTGKSLKKHNSFHQTIWLACFLIKLLKKHSALCQKNQVLNQIRFAIYTSKWVRFTLEL